jgi:hypothetical protein
MNGVELRKPGPVRRTIALVLAVALISVGGWFLYLHLDQGDEINKRLVIA